MKKLFLIRHGKSDWSNILLDDFDRPLNKRGKNDVPLMANILKEKNISPDLILASPAKRTKTTAKIIAKNIAYLQDIQYDENIYEASAKTIVNLIKEVDNQVNTFFLVGHNPSLNIFTSQFINFKKNIPTTGIIEIEFNCDNWRNIEECKCRLISFDYPKKYK